METWGVLVWNMALMSRGRNADKNMTYLLGLVEEHGVSVALLNETSVSHMRAANAAAVMDGIAPPFTFCDEGTIGRDSWTDKHGVRKLKNRTRWSTAVMSALGPELLGEDDVRAMSPSRTHPRRPDIPFVSSRPGTWVVATVRLEQEAVTCVSLYGLIEELTDASMHRSLSDISPIFSDPLHNELVILGGDFNISTAFEPPAREWSRIVLERIEAYGLTDCLALWRENEALPPLAGCPCDDAPCRHTLTRLIPNKGGSAVPWRDRTPFQVDYLFASKSLANRLDEVIEIPPDEWEPYSDHSPIIARFRAG